MIISGYRITCPTCSSQVRVVTEMVSPVIVYCKGCERALVLGKNDIFTLPFEYINNLMKKHPVRCCGNVLDTRLSRAAKQLISTDKISKLHSLLEQKLDVKDFINKIN